MDRAQQQTPSSEQKPKVRFKVFAFLGAFGAFVAGLTLGALVTGGEIPQYWEAVTRHSDQPAQVLDALEKLEAELATKHNFYVTEIHFAKERAARKATEASHGIGEPGETVDEARRHELKASAPEWMRVHDRAEAILSRYAVRE